LAYLNNQSVFKHNYIYDFNVIITPYQIDILNKSYEIEDQLHKIFTMQEEHQYASITGSIRSAWRIPCKPIEDLTKLLERKGIFIVNQEFDNENTIAIGTWLLPYPPVIYVNCHIPHTIHLYRFHIAKEFIRFIKSDASNDELNLLAAELLMCQENGLKESKPKLLNKVLNFYMDKLGYEKNELAKVIQCNIDDLDQLIRLNSYN